MKHFVLFILLTGLLTDCKKTDDPQTVCQPPSTLVAQAPCESGYPGALLIASNYKEVPLTSMLFEVWPQKDTLSSDLLVRSWKNGSSQHDRILIGEDVLRSAPKFIVQVTINCAGKDTPSPYFSFVRRTGSNPSCYVWARKAL